MAALLTILREGLLAQVQDPDTLMLAAFGVATLSSIERWRGRDLLAIAGRFVACLLVCAVVNTVMELVWPNFHVQTAISVAILCAIIRDHSLPVRLALASIVAASWSYSAGITVLLGWETPAPSVLRAAYAVAVAVTMWLLDTQIMGPDVDVSPSEAAFVAIICAAGIVTQVILMSVLFGEHEELVAANAVVCAYSQIVDLVAYGMFALTVRNHNERLWAQEERYLMERRLEALQGFRLSEQSLRELRHEVKNQYEYIRMLLERKEYDRAEAFFGEMSMHANPTLSLAGSGNHLVDDIVNLEISKARSEGVRVDARIAVPSSLTIAEIDFCSLLTNLLDNAIEACHDVEDKVVSLSVSSDLGQDELVIVVRNPCAHPPRTDGHGKLLSAKTGQGHGYGTGIVRQIAEKYDGVADFRYSNGTFVARVMIALPSL